MPTIFLRGVPYGFVEQDWSAFPGVARRILRDTLRVFWLYWACVDGVLMYEDGQTVSVARARHRVMELSAGIRLLLPRVN